MSSKDKFFNRAQFSQLVAAMGDGLDKVGAVQEDGAGVGRGG
jgi:hypothetical protein